MEIAGHLQWIVPLGVFIVGYIRSSTRKVVSYEHVNLVFDDKLDEIGLPDSFGRRLGAARFTFINNSLSALENVRIEFTHINAVSFGQFTGSTLGRINQSCLNRDDGLEITIPEFPTRETVTLDILYKHPSIIGVGAVSGGGNKYRIQGQEQFKLERLSFWLQVAVLALASGFVVFLVRSGLT